VEHDERQCRGKSDHADEKPEVIGNHRRYFHSFSLQFPSEPIGLPLTCLHPDAVLLQSHTSVDISTGKGDPLPSRCPVRCNATFPLTTWTFWSMFESTWNKGVQGSECLQIADTQCSRQRRALHNNFLMRCDCRRFCPCTT
jgi:hypothetical protein